MRSEQSEKPAPAHLASGRAARRRRATRAVTRVLVDTSPDLREQLLDAEVDWLDGVLYTHEHADHTHGIDDLRALFIKQRRRVDVYLDEPTGGDDAGALRLLLQVAARQRLSADRDRAPADRRNAGDHRRGRAARSRRCRILQQHGDIPSLGFRFGNLAYSCDLSGLPPESVAALAGLDVWIVDALRYRPHPSHFSLDDALGWIERLKPRRAILTNLHADLDYEVLRGKLPVHVVPAFDGMSVRRRRGPLNTSLPYNRRCFT